MKNRNLKLTQVLLLSVICLITSSCSGQSNNTQAISDIRVSKTDHNIIVPAYTEEFPLPNCGGSSELTQTLGAQASVKKTVTIGGTATVRGGGEAPISHAVQATLEAEITIAFSETLQNENSRLDSIGLKAAPGTHVVYVIQWVDEQYSSTISYLLEGKTYDTDYVYTLRIPKISNSYAVNCPTSNSGESFTPVPLSQPILLRLSCGRDYVVRANEPIRVYYGGWAVKGLDLAQQWATALTVDLMIGDLQVSGEQHAPATDLPHNCSKNDFEGSFWIYYTTTISGLSPGEHDVTVTFSTLRALPESPGGENYPLGEIIVDTFKITAK